MTIYMETLIKNITLFNKNISILPFLFETRFLILTSYWNYELIVESQFHYKEHSIFNKISRIFITIEFPIVRSGSKQILLMLLAFMGDCAIIWDVIVFNRCEVSWTTGQLDKCCWLSHFWDILLIIVRGTEGEATRI